MPFSDRTDPEPVLAGFNRQGDPVDVDYSVDETSHVAPGERHVLSVSTLVGDRVRNREGEDLGTVEEVMLDISSGQIAYVVLSFGGFLGIGDKLFAVPWSSLALNDAQHEFLLDVDKKTLESAPGFDKDHWPDMADANWGSAVHAHYGQQQYWSRDITTPGPGETSRVRSAGSVTDSEIVETRSPERTTYNG